MLMGGRPARCDGANVFHVILQLCLFYTAFSWISLW